MRSAYEPKHPRAKRLRALSAIARLAAMTKIVRDPANLERQRQQAARLRRLRIAHGISQADAARICSVSVFKFNRIELGQHPIDTSALELLFVEFGAGADYVISGKRSTLPDDLHDAIVMAELHEAQQARDGTLPVNRSADIWARLRSEQAGQPPPHKSQPLAIRSKRKKSDDPFEVVT